MFCKFCGKELPDGSKFCSDCGANLEASAAGEGMQTDDVSFGAAEGVGRYVTPNIVLCEDGIYRWYYDFNMLKNPTILFTVFKVLGFSFGIVWLFVAIIDAVDGGGLEGVLKTTGIFLIIMAVFAVIGSISYLIVAAMYGGSYMVLFEMNDREVTHIQMPKQFKKAEAIGWLTTLVGIAAGKPAMMGQGLLVASKSSSTSVFGNVTTVKVRRRLNTIHVNQLLEKNQVYALPEDFDFVESFILSHCTKAKVK